MVSSLFGAVPVSASTSLLPLPALMVDDSCAISLCTTSVLIVGIAAARSSLDSSVLVELLSCINSRILVVVLYGGIGMDTFDSLGMMAVVLVVVVVMLVVVVLIFWKACFGSESPSLFG